MLVDPESAETLDVLGATVQVLTPPAGDHDPCVIRGAIPPHGFVPLHSHPDPETFVLLAGAVEGLGESERGLEWATLGAGDVFHVPGDARHAWRNPGAEPAVSLIATSARIGRFFREIGVPLEPGTAPAPPPPERVAKFLAVAERYGHWNATPEENAAIGLTLPPG